MTLNLHALTVRISEESPDLIDPGDLAEAVFAALDPADHAEALRQTLRGYVRVTVNNHERRALEPEAVLPVPEVPVRRSRARSGYVEAMQAGVWRSRLEHRYPGAEGAWKLLRDFTLADCEAAVAEYGRRAVQEASRSDWFNKISRAVEEHRAGTVADLPEDTLKDLLN